MRFWTETDPDSAVAAYLIGSLIVGNPEEHDHTHHSETEQNHPTLCGCNG